MPYGGLIRSIHTWGAHLFIAVVCLHLLTTLFTRAYRKPRELTWRPVDNPANGKLADGFFLYWVGAETTVPQQSVP